jgi:hypothetical protein
MAEKNYREVTVKNPDGTKSTVRGPIGATDDEILAYAAEQFYAKKQSSGGAGQVLSDATSLMSVPTLLQAGKRVAATPFMRGAKQGAEDVLATVESPFLYAGNKLGVTKLTPAQNRAQFLKENLEGGIDPEDLAFQGGRFAGNMAATAPIGPLLGAGAKALGAKNLGTALGSVQGLNFSGGLGSVGTQLLGKGITGAASSAAVDPTLETAGYGAVANMALPDIIKLGAMPIKWTGKAIGNIARPYLPGGSIRSAGRMARELAGEKVDDIMKLLGRAKPGETAGQAAVPAGSAEFSAGQKIMKNYRPSEYAAIEAKQEAARKASLANITPNLDEAKMARAEATGPLYQVAEESTVPLDEELSDLLTRMPRGTVRSAKDIARMESRPFVMGEYKPPTQTSNSLMGVTTTPEEFPEITGAALHDIKRALSDKAFGPMAATGAGRDAQAASRSVMDDYLAALEDKVPSYGQARQTYAEMSKPVNQAELLGRAKKVLEGPGGAERVGPFLNILGSGEDTFLKHASGAPRYKSLEEALTPEQFNVIQGIGGELNRDLAESGLAQAGAQKAREEIYKFGDQISTPQFLDRAWVVARSLLKGFEGVGTQRTINSLSELMMDPARLAEVMRKAAPADRQILQKAMQLLPAATAATQGAAPQEGEE